MASKNPQSFSYLVAVEEDLRNLGNEAKKRHPEVKEATDRAITALKAIRDQYVSDKMKNKGSSGDHSGKSHQSADISAPYILLCNYADANPKLIGMALNGIQMLINNDLIPANDAKNILRVLSIQASSGRSEQQLKLLQILLQLVNSLSKSAASAQHLTEATVCSFLTLSLQLCDGRSSPSLSVSSTALATARQVLAIVMDGAYTVFFGPKQTNVSNNSISTFCNVDVEIIVPTPAQINTSFTQSSLLLIRDISLFMRSLPGEWLKGVTIPQSFALDLMHDALTGWKKLFQTLEPYKAIIKESICPALKPLLQQLQEDFIHSCGKSTVQASAALTSRVVRIARCIMLDFITSDIVNECTFLMTLLTHSLQPDRMNSDPKILKSASSTSNTSSISGSHHASPVKAKEAPTTSLFQDASILLNKGVGGLMSTLNIPIPPAIVKGSNAANLNQAEVPMQMLVLSASRFIHSKSSDSAVSGIEIPSHPAGVCLEALISFFLSPIPESLCLASPASIQSILALIDTCVACVCNLICGSLSIESNLKDFEDSLSSSQLISIIEALLSGTESDVNYTIISIHEQIMSSTSIKPSEVVALSVHLLQILTRLTVKLSLQTQAEKLTTSMKKSTSSQSLGNEIVGGNFVSDRDIVLFIPNQSLSAVGISASLENKDLLSSLILKHCESSYEHVQEACVNLLLGSEYAVIVRRSLNILSETALSSGILGLRRPCEVIISSLCKFTVPRWHGQEMLQPEQAASSTDLVRWRHVAAFIRLVQIIHVLADSISDWDTIVDTMEQLVRATLTMGVSDGDVSLSEIEKIFQGIERFKSYTIFLSDDALVKLMTSLVALSINNLAGPTPRAKKGTSGAPKKSKSIPSNIAKFTLSAPSYMQEAILLGEVNFSLQAAVEITKRNTHRISTVWQMVSSHLRMIASLKSSSIRSIAVAATQDIIFNSLDYMKNDLIVPLPRDVPQTVEDLLQNQEYLTKGSILLTDYVIQNQVMPSFDTAFIPRDYHKLILTRRCSSPSILPLSQNELLKSLNILANIRYDDIRNDIVQGLLRMLQDTGELINTGWAPIVDLLSMVPASLPTFGALAEEMGDEGAENGQRPWPKTALSNSFNCMKLIVDEFLDMIPLDVTKALLMALSYFAAQGVDVNISLTSVEMLWKVGDLSLTRPHTEGLSGSAGDRLSNISVLEIMMQRLLVLSTDGRPEIRNCGMNTLFSAVTANASLLTSTQWKQVFDEVIFPLFIRTEERQSKAIKYKEEAKTVELKKGVKMALHHSRDSAHKQWAETRSTALRGLSRVIKTCTKSLLFEEWFKDTWIHSIAVCKDAIQATVVDQEVALAAVDVLFSMMKMVSLSTSTNTSSIIGGTRASGINDSVDAEQHEDGAIKQDEHVANDATAREDLWYMAWTSVKDISRFDAPSQELPFHICQQLSTLYSQGLDGEFRYSENIRGLLDMITVLSRPRMILPVLDGNSVDQHDVNTTVPHDSPIMPTPSVATGNDRVAEVRLYQSIISILKSIRPTDIISAGLLVSALAEILFAVLHAQIPPFFDEGLLVCLSQCPDKLRSDASDYLGQLLSPALSNSTDNSLIVAPKLPKGTNGVILEVLFRRYVDDVCFPSVQRRCAIRQGLNKSSNKFEKGSSTKSNSSTKSVDKGKPEESKAPIATTGVTGLFSSISKLLSASTDVDNVTIPPKVSFKAPVYVGDLHRLKHYATIHSINTANSDSNEFTIFTPSAIELNILLLALNLPDDRIIVTTAAPVATRNMIDSMSPITWSNILQVLGCILSPWLKCEIPQEVKAVDASISVQKGVLKSAVSLLRRIMHAEILAKLCSSWSESLFDIIASTARLIIHALYTGKIKKYTDMDGNDAVSYYFSSIINEIGSALETVVQTPDLPVYIYTGATGTLLTITRDLCLISLQFKENIVNRPELERASKHYLKLISMLDSSWDCLPPNFSALIDISFNNIADEWLNTLLGCNRLNATNANDNSTPPSNGSNRIDNSDSVHEQTSKKAHLLVLLPLIVKLASDSEVLPSIRDAAIEIITNVNIAVVVMSYMDLLHKNHELTDENNRLKSECGRLTSTQHFNNMY